MTLFLGLALAGLSALVTQVGFLLRHRGAVAAPEVKLRHPIHSAITLFRSKWWTIGYALAIVTYMAAMLVFEAALAALGVVLMFSCNRGRTRAHHGILLALAAGLLFTTTHVAVKALSGKIDAGIAEILLSPYLYIAIAGGVVAFFASARSLQIGPAVPVIAVTAIAGNASAIPAGILVFGDPLGGETLTVIIRTVAFLLVVAAAALIPAPTRAMGETELESEEPERETKPHRRGTRQPALT